MGSDVRHVRGEAQKELVKKFEVFTSKGRSRWQVWSDWITISAIAVSNATDKSHFDEREQQYMTIVKKYTKQEVDAFADMFSILVIIENVSGVDYIEIRGILSEKQDIEDVEDGAMLTGAVPVSISQQPVVTMDGIRVVKA